MHYFIINSNRFAGSVCNGDLHSEYSDPTFYWKTPEKGAHEGTMVALRRPLQLTYKKYNKSGSLRSRLITSELFS